MAEVAANLLVKVGADVSEAEKKLKGVSSSISGVTKVAKTVAVGAAAAFASIGVAATAFAVKSVGAASDLEESMNKANVVFGKNAAAIQAWSETSNKSLTMSRQQALEAVSTFGNLFDSMGVGETTTAEMSKSLVQLAADLASFNNIDPTEALDKLRSGVVGETEPLRALGVNLSAAAVEAYALERGLAATKDAITPAIKAQASYALILQQTTNAQGDLARTADGWANMNRQLAATVANISAEVGSRLLPVLAPMLSSFIDFVDRVAPAVIQAFTDVIGWLEELGNTFVIETERIASSGDRIREKANELGAATSEMAAGQVSFWEAVGMTIDQWFTNMSARFAHFAESLARGFAVIGEAWEFVKDGKIAEALELIKFSFEEDAKAIDATNEKIISWNDIVSYATENGLSYGEALSDLRDHQDDLAASMVSASDSARGNAMALGEISTAIADVAPAMSSLAEIWSQAWDAIEAATSDGMTTQQRQIMDGLGGIRTEYVNHAIKVSQLQSQMNQALANLDAEYQSVSQKIEEQGLIGKQDQLNAAHAAKRGAIVASYTAQIKTEQIAQTALLNQAKIYYMTTLGIMMRQLRAQIGTVAANMSAMVKIVFSGYSSMTAAVVAYNMAVQGISDIAALQAAMSDVQAAMSSIQADAEAAASAAAGEFENWQAAAADLNDVLGEVDTSLGNIGSGGSGSGPRPRTDPLEQAAQDLIAIANLVQQAVSMFNELAEFGGPQVGWIEAFDQLAEAMGIMVQHWSEVVDEIDALGLLEDDKRNNIIGFSQVVSQVVKAISDAVSAISVVNSYEGAFTVAASAINDIANSASVIVAALEQAASEFEEDGLTAAGMFADTGVKAMALIGKAVDALTELKNYDQSFNASAAGLNKLKAQIVNLTEWLVRIGKDFDEEASPAAIAFAEAGSRVMALIDDAVGALMALKDYDKAFNLVDAGMRELKAQIVNMVAWLVRINETLDQDAVTAAQSFANAAGKVLSVIEDAVTSFMALKDYDKSFSLANAGMKEIKAQILNIISWMARVAADFSGSGLEHAKAFAEAASKILGMVKEAIEVFERLRNYTTPGIEAINRFERDMQYALERWVRWVTLTLQPLAEDLSDETAGLVEGVVLAMGAALETLAGLVTYVSPAETAINEFVDDLGALFTAFHDWAVGEGGSEGSPGMLLEIPPELLAIFQDTMDSLGTAVDTLVALTDYVGPTGDAIASFIADMGALFTAFYGWAMGEGGSEGSPGMLMDIPPELLAVFEAVMSGLGAAVDTLTGLVDYVGPSEDAINTFTSDYALLFEGFADWAQTTFADVTSDTTAAVADVFGDVMSGLGDAVDTLTALVDYVGPSDASITQFELDYQRLFADFVTWADGRLTEDGAALVGAVGEAVGAVFTGLGAAVTTLLAIVGYVGPSETAINRFETDYQRLMTGFRQWATTAWTVEIAALVQAVGDAANSLFTGLGAAATLLIAIRSYTSPAQTAIDGFVADMEALMLTMRDFATGNFTTESLAIVNTFATVAQALFTAMGAALDTLAAIADYTVSDSDFVQALQRFNQNLYTAIHSWQVWIIDIMAPETAALVAAFSGVLADIVDGFRDALNLLMDIEAANLPTTEDLQAFLDALNTLFTAVVSNFQQVSVDLAQAGFDIQTVLYGIFNNINPQLWQAGLQTGAHFIGGLVQSMTSVSIITPLLNAMTDLANQLEDVLRAAWGISSPSKVAKRIGGQFVTGLEQGLQDLYGIPDMMRDALGMPALGLSYEPAPQRAFLTVRFEGAYQTGMSPREEQRITTAMVSELRRQGVALATR